MTSKLYKELGYSILLGAACSYTYVYYYKRIYLNLVDEFYFKLKDKFDSNPILSTIKEDERIIKNFGYNKHSDHDDEDEDDEEFEEQGFREMGIFEGDPEMEKNEYKERILEHFYGS